MKLASHNSFSYLPVRHWWMWPFAWMAKCQRRDIFSQFLYGVRMFELRVRFVDNTPVICHGLIEYKMSEKELADLLDHFDYGKCNYMRVVLETRKPDKNQEAGFYFFCKRLEETFTHIKFFGGNNRADWLCQNPIYKFSTSMPDIEHKYSSTTSLFPDRNDKWRYIDDLFPWLYARLNNHKNIVAGTEHDWLMIDFVDIC